MPSLSVVKPGWSTPDAVLYQSFDSPDGLVLMESSEPVGPVPLVTGQVMPVSTKVAFVDT